MMKYFLISIFAFSILIHPKIKAELDFQDTLHFMSKSEADIVKLYSGWRGYQCNDSLTENESRLVHDIISPNNKCSLATVNTLDTLDDLYFHEQALTYKEALSCELQKNDCFTKGENALSYLDAFFDRDIPYYILMNKHLNKSELTEEEKAFLKFIDNYIPDDWLKEKFKSDSCEIKKSMGTQLQLSQFEDSSTDCFESIKYFLKLSMYEKYVSVFYDEYKIPIQIILQNHEFELNKASNCELVEIFKKSMKDSLSDRRLILEKEQNKINRSCQISETDKSTCFYKPLFPTRSFLLDFGFQIKNGGLNSDEKKALEKYYCHLNQIYGDGRSQTNKELNDTAIPVLGLVVSAYGIKILAKPFLWAIEPISAELSTSTSLIAATASKAVNKNSVLSTVKKTAITSVKTGVVGSELAALGLTVQDLSKSCIHSFRDIEKTKPVLRKNCSCEELLKSPLTQSGDPCRIQIAKKMIEMELNNINNFSKFAIQSKEAISVVDKNAKHPNYSTIDGKYNMLLVKHFSPDYENIVKLFKKDFQGTLTKVREKYKEGRKTCSPQS